MLRLTDGSRRLKTTGTEFGLLGLKLLAAADLSRKADEIISLAGVKFPLARGLERIIICGLYFSHKSETT